MLSIVFCANHRYQRKTTAKETWTTRTWLLFGIDTWPYGFVTPLPFVQKMRSVRTLGLSRNQRCSKEYVSQHRVWVLLVRTMDRDNCYLCYAIILPTVCYWTTFGFALKANSCAIRFIFVLRVRAGFGTVFCNNWFPMHTIWTNKMMKLTDPNVSIVSIV